MPSNNLVTCLTPGQSREPSLSRCLATSSREPGHTAATLCRSSYILGCSRSCSSLGVTRHRRC